jgi:hypothetical protein
MRFDLAVCGVSRVQTVNTVLSMYPNEWANRLGFELVT